MGLEHLRGVRVPGESSEYNRNSVRVHGTGSSTWGKLEYIGRVRVHRKG